MHPSHACIRIFIVDIGLSFLMSEMNWAAYKSLSTSERDGRVKFGSCPLLMIWGACVISVANRTENNIKAGRQAVFLRFGIGVRDVRIACGRGDPKRQRTRTRAK